MDIKICGLTNLPDAEAALEAGADFLGFVLYPRSPRAVSAHVLRSISEKLAGRARMIGVFVNEQPDIVAGIASDCALWGVQLHGDERHEDFAALNMPVWRAIRIRPDGAANPNPAQWPAERYVVDADAPSLYGGTGTTSDWKAAGSLSKTLPVMLAGGLTPENVGQAIKEVRPKGVDVAGGVESAPGKKDRHKLAAFVSAARKAEVS